MKVPHSDYAFEKHLDGWLQQLSGPAPTFSEKWPLQRVLQLLLLSGVLVWAMVFWPNNFLKPDLLKVTFVLGTLGLWRFGWWFTHAVRAEIFARCKWPGMRRRAQAIFRSGNHHTRRSNAPIPAPPHAFCPCG